MEKKEQIQETIQTETADSKFRRIFETLSTTKRKEFVGFAKWKLADTQSFVLIDELIQGYFTDRDKANLQAKFRQNKANSPKKANRMLNEAIVPVTDCLKEFIVLQELNAEENPFHELQKLLHLVQYYRKHHLIESLLKDVLNPFKEKLKKIELNYSGWEMEYYRYQYNAFLLEYTIATYVEKDRKSCIFEMTKEIHELIHQGFASAYLYQMLLNFNLGEQNMAFQTAIFAYLETQPTRIEPQHTLKEVYEELKTPNEVFTLAACLRFFPLTSKNPSLQSRQIAKLPPDAQLNIHRLFLQKWINLAQTDQKHYANVYDFYLAGFCNDCLLMGGKFPEREYKLLLRACLYKYEAEFCRGLSEKEAYDLLEDKIETAMPKLRQYIHYQDKTNKSNDESTRLIVLAYFYFQQENYKLAHKYSHLYKNSLYRKETPFLALYSLLGLALVDKKGDFEEVSLHLKQIRAKKAFLQEVEHSTYTLTAFAKVLKFAKKPNKENYSDCTDCFESQKFFFLKDWLSKQVEEIEARGLIELDED